MTVPPQLSIEDVLERIAAGVVAGQFRVVLFGGCALPFHGVERLTLDIDVMMTDTDTNAFAGWMGEMGYQQVQRTPQCAKFRHSVGEARLPDIDTVFVDAPVMDKIWTESAVPATAPAQIRVASLAIMVGTKLHALKYNAANRAERSDLLDIVGMLRAANIQASDPWLRELCRKYGTDELWQDICRHLST